MDRPKLSLSGYIAPKDPWLEAWGIEDVNVSAEMVREFLDDNKEADEIEIYLDSYGGSVSEGFKIYDLLTTSGKKVIFECTAACSIATVVFLAGDERYLTANADFMIHNARFDESAFWGKQWTADELEEMLQSVKEADGKILDFFVEKLGDDKRQELTDEMANEKFMSIDRAIELGFATGRLEEREGKSKSTKALLFTDLIINKLEMSKPGEKTGFKNFLDEMRQGFQDITNLIKPKPTVKNVVLQVVEGPSIYVEETEDGGIEGQTAYIANEDGTASEEMAPEGDHVLEDGRTISVSADGVITAVSEASEENELEQARQEIQRLKDQLAEKEGTVKDQKTKIGNLEAAVSKFKELQNKFTEMENKIAFEDEEEEEEVESRKDPKAKKLGIAGAIAAHIRQKSEVK
ncbi:ATP-dependent Clp protease proteolytic subunit [Croceimicrobium sp.]|uniref:Clp protease ClpP n=1 Tax=Croceimicrobium sp. TaxID=2828340 RepID=UPI003BACB539